MMTGVYDIQTVYARLPRRLHQHRADRRLSRRRPPGGGVPDRAADGRGGARRRAFADRDPAAELHQAGADALQDRHRPHLRHRRVRGAHGQGARRRRRRRRSRRVWRRARQARQDPRAWLRHLYRDLRLRRTRSRRRSVLEADGTVSVHIGTQSNGQGHQTAYAQFVGGHLGLDYDKIRVVQGDSDDAADGRRHRRLALRSRSARPRSTSPRSRSPSSSRRSPPTSLRPASATSSLPTGRRASSAPTAASPTPTSPRRRRTSRS